MKNIRNIIDHNLRNTVRHPISFTLTSNVGTNPYDHVWYRMREHLINNLVSKIDFTTNIVNHHYNQNSMA